MSSHSQALRRKICAWWPSALKMAYSDGDRSHCSAKAAVHGRPGALRSADMHDTSRALLQAASGSHSGLPQKHGQAPKRRTSRVEQARMHVREKPRGGRTPRCRRWHGRHLYGVSCCWSHGAQVSWACAPLACIEDLSGATGGPSARAPERPCMGAARTARGSAPLAAALEPWPSVAWRGYTSSSSPAGGLSIGQVGV